MCREWGGRELELLTDSEVFLSDMFLLVSLMEMSSTPDRIPDTAVLLELFSCSFIFRRYRSPSAQRLDCFLWHWVACKQALLMGYITYKYIKHWWNNRHRSPFSEVLLRSDDWTGSADPDPCDGFSCCYSEVFHHVTGNQGTRPAQTRWTQMCALH